MPGSILPGLEYSRSVYATLARADQIEGHSRFLTRPFAAFARTLDSAEPYYPAATTPSITAFVSRTWVPVGRKNMGNVPTVPTQASIANCKKFSCRTQMINKAAAMDEDPT